MEYKYKQLEEELSGLSKLLADLGTRLSEAGKEVSASAVLPSDKLVEQISTSRATFESARIKVHGHAAAMLVMPLPKPDELTSLAAIRSLLKGAAAAEENKYSIEGEREQALKALARALSLAHREVADFKPLQDCQAKLGDLRKAILNVTWPHRHPEAEPLAESRHPVSALLHFVENLDTIEDEQWITLEATISGVYGKPLFVAATRGKLEIREAKAGVESKAEPRAEVKVDPKPPEPDKPAGAAPPKPAAAAEKPVEKPMLAEKAPEKAVVVPAAAPAAVAPVATAPAAPAPIPAPETKKIVTPAASAAPAVVAPAPVAIAEKKEAVAEKAPEKPAVPHPVVVAPAAVIPVNVTPAVVVPAASAAPVSAKPTPEPAPKVVVTPEKKEAAEKPQPVLSPAPAPLPSLVPAVSIPSVAHTAAAVVSAPAASALSQAPRAGTPVPAPMAVASVPAPTPAAPPIPAGPIAETVSHTPPAPAGAALNSLSALASATEPSVERKLAGPVPIDAVESSRREARLSAPAPQPVSKTEPAATNGMAAGEDPKTGEGDGQRPQRWGFWRGNR